MNLDQIIELLIQIKRDTLTRKKNIILFQHDWSYEIDVVTNDVQEIFADLAVDFSYYVDDEKMRSQDKSFYGPEKLEKLIQEAFNKLEKLGINIPKQ